MKLVEDNSPVEIVAIIDRSGSMSTIYNDSLGGFNSFLQAQKEIKSPANISVVLFDNTYTVLYDDVNIQAAEPLTTKTYVLGGSTAMNDAIGKALTKMLEKNPSKAIICILTDGEENASREFTTPQIKGLIEQAQGKGWQVQFLAANQDAFQTGASYGILAGTTKNFTADKVGTQTAYMSMNTAVASYRGG